MIFLIFTVLVGWAAKGLIGALADPLVGTGGRPPAGHPLDL
jgi:hypothetical protein